MASKPKEAFAKLQEGVRPVQQIYTENRQRDSKVNMSDAERWMSSIGGGALTVYGLSKGGWGGFSLAALGGGLIYWGVTGHCDIYGALNVNQATGKGSRASVKHGEGIKVVQSVMINKSPEELFQFWRKVENLPRVMSHLESVRVLDSNLSHWVAKAPAGMTVEWDAQIINEKENELLAWRSLEGATIPNAGSVHFDRAPAGRGTIVRVEINYDPPGGNLGAALAKMFGEEPSLQVEEDLRRFKRMMEAGEIPTTAGQPSGREATAQTSDRESALLRGWQGEEQRDEIPADRILSHGR